MQTRPQVEVSSSLVVDAGALSSPYDDRCPRCLKRVLLSEKDKNEIIVAVKLIVSRATKGWRPRVTEYQIASIADLVAGAAPEALARPDAVDETWIELQGWPLPEGSETDIAGILEAYRVGDVAKQQALKVEADKRQRKVDASRRAQQRALDPATWEQRDRARAEKRRQDEEDRIMRHLQARLDEEDRKYREQAEAKRRWREEERRSGRAG